MKKSKRTGTARPDEGRLVSQVKPGKELSALNREYKREIEALRASEVLLRHPRRLKQVLRYARQQAVKWVTRTLLVKDAYKTSLEIQRGEAK